MVRTTWRCGTGASTSFCSHSAHRSWRFFSHDGQKDLPRHENGQSTCGSRHQSRAKPWETIPHSRNPRSTRSTTGRRGPWCRAKRCGPHAQQLLEVLLHQTEKRRLARPSRLVDPTADLHTSRPAGGRASGENRRGPCPSRPAPGGREEVSTAGGSGRVRAGGPLGTRLTGVPRCDGAARTGAPRRGRDGRRASRGRCRRRGPPRPRPPPEDDRPQGHDGLSRPRGRHAVRDSGAHPDHQQLVEGALSGARPKRRFVRPVEEATLAKAELRAGSRSRHTGFPWPPASTSCRGRR